MLNYTLEQGPEYYDSEFKGKFATVEAQTAKLAELLTEKSKEGDKDVYWSVDSKVSKIEEPTKGGKNAAAGGTSSSEVQIFDQPQIDKYMQAYARAFEKRDEPFRISWVGPKGAQFEESFQYDTDKRKIVRNTQGKSLLYFNNSDEFRDYLRSIKTVKKTPLKA